MADSGVLERGGNEVRLQPSHGLDVPTATREHESPATAATLGELKLVSDRQPTEPLDQGV